MHSIIRIVFTSILLGVALAHVDRHHLREEGTKKPCTGPSQFTAEMNKFFLDENDCVQNYKIGHVYFDYLNKQMRFDAISHSEEKQSTTWFDFSKEMGYILNRASGDCYSFPTNKTMHSPFIPSDASYASTKVIGSQSVDMWSTSFSEGKYGLIGATAETCYLESMIIIDGKRHQPEAIFSFWNVIPTLPPYFFDLPDKCAEKSIVIEDLDRATLENPFTLFL
eukprot:TRINITY_DN8771_c0_g1_i1.p1 TRINITY_DN8771_c0_g1~~TRINITY_DN8771_c0_g1_i1.p1  ORF type:complete len:223 (-),score=43.03 TRINITY_DN8771_c0_g1_i1:26-694(-)